MTTGKAKSNRSFVKSVGATFLRQIAGGLIGLLSAAVVARVYGPTGNGEVALALLFATGLSTFLNLGVGSANAYYLGSGKMTFGDVLSANLKVYLCLICLGACVGIGVIYFFAGDLFSGVSGLSLQLALTLFPLILLTGLVASLFQGLQDFKSFNTLTLLPAVFLFLGVVSLWFLASRQTSDVIFIHILSHVLALTFVSRSLWRLFRSSRSDNVSGGVGKIVSYGWKAHLSNILAFVNYKADVLLTNFFLGPAATGVYVVSVALGEKLWLISQAVSTVLLPKLSQLVDDDSARNRFTPIVTRWVLVLTALSGFVLAVVANWIVIVIFGEQYSEASVVLWVLLPGLVLAAAARVLANDIAARGRPELNMYTALVVVVANVVGNVVLIPSFGLFGAAAATTVAYSLNLALRLRIYATLSGNRWFSPVLPQYSDVGIILRVLRTFRR